MDDILGAAIFDLNGLPKEYFATADETSMIWVQTIFQALGLRSLLMAFLQLEGFHHAAVQGEEYCAIVVKQKNLYIALLLRQKNEEISDQLVKWVQTFQPEILKSHPRFYVT
ncbi:hypothetical protein KIK02_15545 [Leptodesmis sichuanensis A121]|nr:hypothetical protein KIK02_15545 [Leptodesmis sichuanensis A121]